MHTYRVNGNSPIGEIDIEISRSEIVAMKKQIVADGKYGYSEMLRIMSYPAAIFRYEMIPGTRALKWLLNTCIILGRLGIVVVVVLLFMRHWWWALGCGFVDYLISGPLQTSINYEIGARLFTLDQHLNIWEDENLKDEQSQ